MRQSIIMMQSVFDVDNIETTKIRNIREGASAFSLIIKTSDGLKLDISIHLKTDDVMPVFNSLFKSAEKNLFEFTDK